MNQSRKRRILLTNDDGIGAGGLIRLAEAAVEFGEVWVVAPDGERSAASHSITLHRPFDLYPHAFPVPGVRAYSCTGSPGDCVRAGSLTVMPQKPDVVLSGINYGYNMGTDIQYSATAGAAFEAAFQGYRAIALSEGQGGLHEAADAYLREVLKRLIDRETGYGQILNVNFPNCRLSQCKGILEDRTVSRMLLYTDAYPVVDRLEDGGIRVMAEGTYSEKAEKGTDFRAVMDRYVSIGIVNNIS